jgi:hypothetical protein
MSEVIVWHQLALGAARSAGFVWSSWADDLVAGLNRFDVVRVGVVSTSSGSYVVDLGSPNLRVAGLLAAARVAVAS